MRAVILTVGLALGLAGCAQQVELHTVFNPADAEFVLKDGPNRVSGQAFVRQNGGGVVTCAGSGVGLTPVNAYSTDRMIGIYGNSVSGYLPAIIEKKLPENAEYIRLSRTAYCDAQGNFDFENVPDGEYYVTTYVAWTVGYVAQGGGLMKRVSVSGGKHEKLILTP
ncbi:hypothetical protein [Zavarzinia aquatilis]|nr:hypothetical protein [Zavarzinia aquatilis]